MTTHKKNILVSGYTGFIGREINRNQEFNAKFNILYVRTAEDILQIGKQWLKASTFVNLTGRAIGLDDELWLSNVIMTRQLTRAFLGAGGKKLLHVSSGAVYGNPRHKAGSIEDDLHQAESYYGLTKSIGEAIVHAETNQIQTDSLVVLRLPNIFGENQKKGVIYNLLNNFRQNQMVTINGDGEQLRDFLHVRDLISLIGKIASESQENGAYNLSSPFSMSINNLVSLLRGESSSNVVFKDYDLEQSSLHLDHSKALAHFGEFYSYTMRYLKNDFNWERDF